MVVRPVLLALSISERVWGGSERFRRCVRATFLLPELDINAIYSLTIIYMKEGKKPLLKRWWFWAIAVFVLIIIVSVSGGESPSTDSTGSSDTRSSAPAQTAFGVGDEATVGDLTYKVNSSSEKSSVGSSAFAKTTEGKFVIVNVTVRNNANETKTIDSSLFKMKDGAGREFDYSTEGNTAHMLSGGEDFFLQQVQPGLTVTGEIVFEVPADSDNLQLRVRPGIFSSKYAEINL